MPNCAPPLKGVDLTPGARSALRTLDKTVPSRSDGHVWKSSISDAGDFGTSAADFVRFGDVRDTVFVEDDGEVRDDEAFVGVDSACFFGGPD